MQIVRKKDRPVADNPVVPPGVRDMWLEAMAIAWTGAAPVDWSLERLLDRIEAQP